MSIEVLFEALCARVAKKNILLILQNNNNIEVFLFCNLVDGDVELTVAKAAMHLDVNTNVAKRLALRLNNSHRKCRQIGYYRQVN